MSFHRSVAMCSVCAVALTTTALSAPRAERAFPTFVIFRGGTLKEPVLLTHSNVTIVTVNGRQVANIEKDPLAIVALIASSNSAKHSSSLNRYSPAFVSPMTST